MTSVSVAMPVHRAGPHFGAAAASILNQTLRDLELMIVLNGADGDTRAQAAQLAARDARVRVIELPEANLAAALNAALGLARHELVARMDADDLSMPTRLERQSERMRAEPSLVALGCAFERMNQDGRTLALVSPPTDAGEVRWRLLLENVFAHGSMMLRRSPVLDAGGYDERAVRAQDYELWLRLSLKGYALANLPETLYRYRERSSIDVGGPWLSTPDQARIASQAMLKAWTDLPSEISGGMIERVAEALCGHASADDLARAIGDQMRESGPTQQSLIAMLWAHWRGGAVREHALMAGRRALAREVGERMRSAGASATWLWGAGAHTAWLLEHRALLGVNIRGVIDDRAPGRIVGGFFAAAPEVVDRGEHVLLSSESFENDMWRAGEPLRARGVHMWRFYSTEPEAPADVRRGSALREDAA